MDQGDRHNVGSPRHREDLWVPNTPFATVSVLTQLPVVILVFVIFEWRLRQIKAPRTDKDGPAKGERDWVDEDVVAPAVFTKPPRGMLLEPPTRYWRVEEANSVQRVYH